MLRINYDSILGSMLGYLIFGKLPNGLQGFKVADLWMQSGSPVCL